MEKTLIWLKNRSLAEIALSVTYVHRGSVLLDYESVQACETERRASPLQVTQPYCWSQDPGCLRACEGRRTANDSVHEINCMKYQTRNGLPPGPAPGLPVSERGSGQPRDKPRDPESRPGPGEQEALAGRVFHGVFGACSAAAAGAPAASEPGGGAHAGAACTLCIRYSCRNGVTD